MPKISSSQNYSNSLQKIKNCKEQKLPSFSSNNSDSYNKTFLFNELKDALNRPNKTAAGSDGIYYHFLTHLPDDCLKILFQIFNTIWLSGKTPSSWKETIVVPNLKTKQRPFRSNQLPTDSPHKLSLQDHGTNDQ